MQEKERLLGKRQSVIRPTRKHTTLVDAAHHLVLVHSHATGGKCQSGDTPARYRVIVAGLAGIRTQKAGDKVPSRDDMDHCGFKGLTVLVKTIRVSVSGYHAGRG